METHQLLFLKKWFGEFFDEFYWGIRKQYYELVSSGAYEELIEEAIYSSSKKIHVLLGKIEEMIVSIDKGEMAIVRANELAQNDDMLMKINVELLIPRAFNTIGDPYFKEFFQLVQELNCELGE